MPLSVSAANLAAMRRQHLALRDGVSVQAVSDDVCGLHATAQITPYISLWNRISSFNPDDLEYALCEKSLIRVRAMRGTHFLVSLRILPTVRAAFKGPRSLMAASLAKWGVSKQEFNCLSQAILRALSEKVMTAAEIRRCVPEGHIRVLTRRVGRRFYRKTNLTEILNLMERQGTVLSQTSLVDWNTLNWDGYGERTYNLPTSVRYSVNSCSMAGTVRVRDAMMDMVRRYITSYGPVTLRDIAWWIGLPVSVASSIVESLSEELVEAKVDGLDEDLLDVAPRPKVGQEVVDDLVVRYLPYEDPYLKGLKLRTRLIAATQERQVYPFGEALPSVVAGGRIIGRWSVSQQPGELRVLVRPIGRISARQGEGLRQEGLRLAEFLLGGRGAKTSIRFVSGNIL